MCLALGNYHNMNITVKRIDSEYVGTRNFESLVIWFIALVRSGGDYSFSTKLRVLRTE